MCAARYILHVAISAGLMLTFFTIISVGPLLTSEIRVSSAIPLVSIVVGWISPLVLLSVAPAKAVTRRLIFLALGLLLLIALNELSKLGLDLTAPKLQG